MDLHHLARPTCTTNTHPLHTGAPTILHRSTLLPRNIHESDLSPGIGSPVHVSPVPVDLRRSMDTRPQPWTQAPTRPGTMTVTPWSVPWSVILHERPMAVLQQ